MLSGGTIMDETLADAVPNNLEVFDLTLTNL